MENEHNKLFPEDQARVDAYLKRGYNETERKPFRPLRLLFILFLMVTFFTLFSLGLARWFGVY
ncbi:DUF3094 family protein [Spongiibacter sp. KMU-158]|uniref:DUF3094 family protein n=1 Tax=Spongiibacter pelagi TaxID=2760804 RepID=A0A927GVL3_9GAMM|nr:DUF3094 family protein [Spongiibacter pelagi]MBD2858002.1 DUF3094 family protein [Spongiibacter pelagi]